MMAPVSKFQLHLAVWPVSVSSVSLLTLPLLQLWISITNYCFKDSPGDMFTVFCIFSRPKYIKMLPFHQNESFFSQHYCQKALLVVCFCTSCSSVQMQSFTLNPPHHAIDFALSLHPSDVYSVTLFTQCSVTCGVGVQNRDVYCRLKGTGQVREDLCEARQRPAHLRPCQPAECTHYTWVTGEWEEVSTDSFLLSFPIYILPSYFPFSVSQRDEQMLNHLIKVFIGWVLCSFSFSPHH